MSVKETGKVFTPKRIVNQILDAVSYKSKSILSKHIIDNSCGNGAFLIEIVKRYCDEFIKINGRNSILLKENLEKYIHGIEIDEEEVKISIEKLNKIVNEYDIESVDWDIINENTLNVTKFNNKMDFVVGNPPYVRVHNLGSNFNTIKKKEFSKKGMTDLFIVFYEIGINMLNDNGILGYITPNSIFNSLAGSFFRDYIISNSLLTDVINLGHYQPFYNITTYTAILILDKNNQKKEVNYYTMDDVSLSKVIKLNYNDFYINNNFYFSTKNRLKEFSKIINVKIEKNDIIVKNGLATLADSIFISDDFEFESKNIIPIIKASNPKTKKIIYPYDDNSKILPFDKLDTYVRFYLDSFKNKLQNRSLDKNSTWYSFGRSQGINDIQKNKIAVNTLIKSIKDIKLVYSPPNTAVYSGLYILSLEYDEAKFLLETQNFIDFVKILGKYKNGGYYTFSSSDLNKFLLYMTKKKEEKNE